MQRASPSTKLWRGSARRSKSWLTSSKPNDVTLSQDIGRLDATNPIVLFPVRIETRFEEAALKLRVFPDEIFLNRHETALTVEEQAAGKKYFDDLNSGAVAPLANWRVMVRRFGAERSAYILRIMTPAFSPPLGPQDPVPPEVIPAGKNLTLQYPDVQTRAGTWTRPAEARLPDRWVVMTRRGNTRKYSVGNPIPEPLAFTVDPSASPAQQFTLPNGLVVDDKARWTIDFDRAVEVGMGLSIPLSADDARLGFDRVVVFGIKTSLSAADGSAVVERSSMRITTHGGWLSFAKAHRPTT